jgi:hypothetical protein
MDKHAPLKRDRGSLWREQRCISSQKLEGEVYRNRRRSGWREIYNVSGQDAYHTELTSLMTKASQPQAPVGPNGVFQQVPRVSERLMRNRGSPTLPDQYIHSSRRASSGSTFMARRAGM